MFPFSKEQGLVSVSTRNIDPGSAELSSEPGAGFSTSELWDRVGHGEISTEELADKLEIIVSPLFLDIALSKLTAFSRSSPTSDSTLKPNINNKYKYKKVNDKEKKNKYK